MRFYPSRQARQQAIKAGETTRLDSTLTDGHKHYAVVRGRRVVQNLTGKRNDNLAYANRRAAQLGPDHAAHRVA